MSHKPARKDKVDHPNPVNRITLMIEGTKVVHQIYDGKDAFRHRLVVAGRPLPWRGYSAESVGILPYDHGYIVAVTESWRGCDPFPNPDCLYIVKKVG